MAGELQTTVKSWAERREDFRRQRQLGHIDHATLLRLARIEHEAMVAIGKVQGLTAAGRVAVLEYDLLDKFADASAGGDPFRSDANRLLTEVIRLGIAEVEADLVDTYSTESRRSGL
jgi:hypothetical protein